ELPATWSAVRHLAFGSHSDSAIERELAAQIMRRVSALTHVDDIERALEYRRIISSEAPADELVNSPYAAMHYYAFWPKGDGGSVAEGLDEIRSNQVLCQELDQLLAVTSSLHRLSPRRLERGLECIPLRTHARYYHVS